MIPHIELHSTNLINIRTFLFILFFIFFFGGGGGGQRNQILSIICSLPDINVLRISAYGNYFSSYLASILLSIYVSRLNHCGRHLGKINGHKFTNVKVWWCTFWWITMFSTEKPWVKLFECQGEVFGWLTLALKFWQWPIQSCNRPRYLSQVAVSSLQIRHAFSNVALWRHRLR